MRHTPGFALAIVVTALFIGVIDFIAAMLIFDWAGGNLFGLEVEQGHPAAWAIPVWLLTTAALVAFGVVMVREYCAAVGRRAGDV